MPTCRVCYARTLTDAQRERFYAEPVTMSIYLCPEHPRVHDEALAAFDQSLLIKVRVVPPGTLTNSEESREIKTTLSTESTPPQEYYQ